MLNSPLNNGRAEHACYSEQEIPTFRGNPWLEALPPILSRSEAKERMAFYPEYTPEVRGLPAHVREHMAAGLAGIRHPVGVHAEVESRLSRLMRWGYIARNPTAPYFQADLNAREAALRVEGKRESWMVNSTAVHTRGPQATATGLTCLGITGIGKTVMTEMALGLYPQLIVHTRYNGRPFTQTQVVWLRLQCPGDGSIRTLCENFFHAMDGIHEKIDVPTDYHRDYVPKSPAIQRLIPQMARLATQHGLGLLVLDEVQELQPRGSRAILTFLVQLVNTIGVPVVLVGGIDALPVLQAQFRQARRGASEGDLILSRAQPGRGLRAFVEALWRFQYTLHETELTDAHVDALYRGSAGITHYLVQLWKLAQVRAIATGRERVTPQIIDSVARDSFAQAGPVLRAITEKKHEVTSRMADVEVEEGVETTPFIRGDAEPPAKQVRVAQPTVASEPAAPGAAAAPRRIGRRAAARARDAVPVDETDEAVPLPQLVEAAIRRGEEPHSALKAAGLVDDDLWRRALGLDTPREPV